MPKFARIDEKFEIDGDMFCDGSPQWEDNDEIIDTKKCMRNFKETLSLVSETHSPIHVHNISRKLSTVIDKLYLEKDFFERFKYTCPFNETEHYALIPIYYVSKDVEGVFFSEQNLLHKSHKEMYLDKDWMWNTIFDEDLDLGTIESSLMGSGYTIVTLPSDGDKYFKNVALELETGDYLFCKIILWYNN